MFVASLRGVKRKDEGTVRVVSRDSKAAQMSSRLGGAGPRPSAAKRTVSWAAVTGGRGIRPFFGRTADLLVAGIAGGEGGRGLHCGHGVAGDGRTTAVGLSRSSV